MPTREGTSVLLLAGAVFLLATNLMSGLLFVLDALLVSLLLVGVGGAVLPLRGLVAAREVPVRGIEGAPLPVQVTVTAPRGARFLVVEDGWPGARVRALLPQARAGEPTSLALDVTPERRGRYTLGPLEITSRGMLGVYTARRRIAIQHTVTVWPRVPPVPPQVLAHLAPALEARAARRGREPEDLYGVRDFRSGDNPAHIHWRSSARRGSLVVREFERPLAPAATVVVDLDRRQAPDRLDAAVRAAAAVLQAARGRRADVVLGGWAETWVEHRQWEAAMDWLAVVAPCGPPLAEVLAALGGAGRQVVAIASSAVFGFGPEVLCIVPADEGAPAGGATGRLVYTADGTVQAW